MSLLQNKTKKRLDLLEKNLVEMLRQYKSGQHTKLCECLEAVADLRLLTGGCTADTPLAICEHGHSKKYCLICTPAVAV